MFGTDKQLRRALLRKRRGHLIKRAGERPRAELDVGVRVVFGAEDRVMAARVDQKVVDAPIEVVDGHADAALPQATHVFLLGALASR